MDRNANPHQPLVSGTTVLNHATDAAEQIEPAPLHRAPPFEAVYAAEFDFAWRSLRRLGVPPALLEDAAQDVFVVVNRQLAGFEGRSSMRTWIFSIAIRVAKEHRRRHFRTLEAVPVDPPSAPTPPHDLLERSEAVVLLDRLLGTLDEDKRAIFILAELEQMSVPQIAAAVGANANTVYTRLRAARQRFNLALQEHRARENKHFDTEDSDMKRSNP
jgi:RNA polymerase sigma-70 factor (ECF subfamily)